MEKFARQVADEHLVLTKQIAAGAAEIAHWRANHGDLAKRLALFMQRPDLPVDRIPAYIELINAQSELRIMAERWMSMPAGPAVSVKSDDVSMDSRIGKYLEDASHVFSESPDAMQCIDYIQAVWDADERKISNGKASDWSAA